MIHCNVINTDEISDHDEPYAIFNIKKERFQKRQKYVRDEKNLDMNKYILDFKQLPTSLVYAFDEPDDKISVLNKLVNQCISEHATIKRTKFTRPPASWLKDPEISKAKNVLDNLRTNSRDLNHSDLTVRQNYQTTRNRYKKQLDRKKLLSCGRRKTLETQKKYGKQFTEYSIHQKNALIKILKGLMSILQN